MASSALPTLFPSVRLDKHFFGDGALRQSRPLSPAIRLGAERLFIIGVSESADDFEKDPHPEVAPTIPQVLGQMLNAVFLDSIQTDLESLQRINALVAPLNQKQLKSAGLGNMRVIDTLVISPSRSLSELAREHISELPRSMRWFLQKTGSIKTTGSGGALSYILFEPGYCQRLMQLGYDDTMAQADAVRTFFNVAAPPQGQHRSTQSQHRGVTTGHSSLTKRWLHLIGRRRTNL
jgi:NTE family protein